MCSLNIVFLQQNVQSPERITALEFHSGPYEHVTNIRLPTSAHHKGRILLLGTEKQQASVFTMAGVRPPVTRAPQSTHVCTAYTWRADRTGLSFMFYIKVQKCLDRIWISVGSKSELLHWKVRCLCLPRLEMGFDVLRIEKTNKQTKAVSLNVEKNNYQVIK